MHDVLTDWSNLLHDPNFEWTCAHTLKWRTATKELLSCLQNMSSTNSFMTMTINRCLDYTKASKGFKLVPTFETVSLQQALDMPVKLIQGAQHAVTIRLNDISEDICSHIITDKQWLIENLLCLLSNASKYSSKGIVDISVTHVTRSTANNRSDDSGITKPTRSSPFLRFEVQDTGVGLSDEAMQTLFNPFKQAQRLAGGTGLGLFSLAKRVEALHGQYGVGRRPDGEQGSLFWFTIPYRPDETSAQLPCTSSASASVLSPTKCSDLARDFSSNGMMSPGPALEHSSGAFKVLVVDDAPLIVKMTTMLLQRKGHTVQHAVNGSDALEKLCVSIGLGGTPTINDDIRGEDKNNPLFDVVLMDLQMPVLDGIEAIRRLRAAESNFRQGLLLTSSSPHEESKFFGGEGREGGEGGDLDLECGMSMMTGGGSAGIAMTTTQPPPPQQLSRARVPSFYHQYVVAVSANSDNDTVEEALRAGADSFIEKPFTYDCFQQVMQNKTPPPYPV